MDNKYKKLSASEDEELEAITGGVKIRTLRIFNVQRHRGGYKRRLREKDYLSAEEALGEAISGGE
ncbi:MAG: hypothetical protein LBR79_01715 [Oscillospiraceae bacterium]|nr:hypothetical protein [Oscillospiraceae bacterium]